MKRILLTAMVAGILGGCNEKSTEISTRAYHIVGAEFSSEIKKFPNVKECREIWYSTEKMFGYARGATGSYYYARQHVNNNPYKGIEKEIRIYCDNEEVSFMVVLSKEDLKREQQAKDLKDMERAEARYNREKMYSDKAKFIYGIETPAKSVEDFCIDLEQRTKIRGELTKSNPGLLKSLEETWKEIDRSGKYQKCSK